MDPHFINVFRVPVGMRARPNSTLRKSLSILTDRIVLGQRRRRFREPLDQRLKALATARTSAHAESRLNVGLQKPENKIIRLGRRVLLTGFNESSRLILLGKINLPPH